MKRALASVLLLLPFAARPARAGDPPAWPPLEKQLAGVVPGGALEALVKANQDFGMLRADERSDGLGYPPWLRVWWRKGHPGAHAAAKDPTKGYPHVLHEILDWMLAHQDLRRAASATPAGDVAPGPLSVAVGTNANVSGTQTAPRSESDIRINFGNTSQVIAASNDIETSGRQATYFSSDGGATWGSGALPFTASDSVMSDPGVDWTSDGTAWSATIGIAGSTLQLRMYRSADAGQTYAFESTMSGTQTATDKEMIWADHASASPYRDRIYAIWHDGQPAYVNRRTPGASGTWLATPLQVSGAETTGTAIGGDVKTNDAGDVFAFWPDTGSSGVYVAKSTNGGDAFGAPVHVATTFGSYEIMIPAMASRQALLYASAAAYRSGLRDEVTVTWTDLAGGTGCSVPADAPGTNVASTCTSRVWCARSTDGGATWGAAAKVNEDGGLHDQFNQALTIDPATGTLALVYYDTVADPNRLKTDLFTQSSFDGGLTWTCPVKVTTAQTDETVSGADLGNQYGDYNAVSGLSSRFLPSWTDRRSGGYEQIWTAPLTTSPQPGPPATGTISVPGPNQIQVTWGAGSPAPASYGVWRAVGSCASPGAFQEIATSAGSPYTDAVVSGGVTYAYEIASLDGNGCEIAPRTACLSATATGGCLLPPTFSGITSAAPAQAATCTVTLTWPAATPGCAGPVAYNVYRSTTPGFTPSAANRIQSLVSGTTADDAAGLVNGTTYYYVVRAVDLSDGLEDGNLAQASAVPQGPLVAQTFTETFEGASGFDHYGWSHSAMGGPVDWVLSTAYSASPTHSWFSEEQIVISERTLTSPEFVPTSSTVLSFQHTYAFEGPASACYDGALLEASTNGGSTWYTIPPGSFTSGGYNGVIATGWGNPLAGQPAWCGGAFGTMTSVSVNLGPFAGTHLRVRWHEGDDRDGAVPTGGGWYVDSVTVTNASYYGTCATGPSATKLYTLAPCRLLDTRNPAGALGGPALAGGGAVRTFALAGTCGVPADAVALSVNLTVVDTASDGDLRVFAGGAPVPPTSVINFRAGQVRANNAVVKVSTDGTSSISVRNDGLSTTDFLVDVNGFFR